MLIAAQVIPQAVPISTSIAFVLIGFVMLAFGIIVGALILSRADRIRGIESGRGSVQSSPPASISNQEELK